ncbi:MAG: protein BatD [Ignavibacteria bacterium]|nr:protein BatD [Ignavibacteria bacterium]
MFSASASNMQVTAGEQFQVTFTLSGGSLKQYKDFRQPDLNTSFLTLAGPSTSQSMQWINGKTSTSISWTYILQPRNAGQFTIQPATIVYDGAVMKSNPMIIKVVNAAPGVKQQQQQQKAQEDKAVNVELGDNLFIRAIVDKRTVYMGEPILVTYKLYSRVTFQVNNIAKIPRMVGFWSEDIETPSQVRPEVENYNGKQYETFLLRKVVYFPTQAGELSIDPFEINCTIQVRQKRKSGDDFFDRFFSDPYFDSHKNVQKSLLTEKIPIHVKALPEDGKPESFRGAVGSYSMRTTLDRGTLKANEPATLLVTIKGEGNLKLLEEPALNLPTGIEHYDPKITEDIVRSSGRITGSKAFEFVLIPRFPGKLEIPPVAFSYFDPETKKYVTLTSPAYTLDVKEGDQQSASSGTAQSGIRMRAKDLHPLKAPDTFGRASSAPVSPLSMFLLYLLPVALTAGALVYKKRWDRIHGDVTGLRMRRSTRIAEKHLSKAKGFLQKNAIDAYYLEIARALWGYVQNRLAMPTSDTSVQNVVEHLTARDVYVGVVLKVQGALTATDEARYSPTRATEGEMRGLYDKAKEAIVSMEQALKG